MSFRPARRRRERLARSSIRVLGWVVGAPLALFRFLRREVEIVELDTRGVAPPLPADDPDVAKLEREAGVGPVIHRLYRAAIRDPKLRAGSLLNVVAADPNVIAPSEVLRFEKTRGEPGPIAEGDELLIRMAGPWNAPVTVTRRRHDVLTLAATRGNPQLGQLDLRVRDEGPHIVMEIQTRERAAGLGFHALQRIGLIRRMQSYTWAEMLENASQLAGGRRPDQITVGAWRQAAARAGARTTAASASTTAGSNCEPACRSSSSIASPTVIDSA